MLLATARAIEERLLVRIAAAPAPDSRAFKLHRLEVAAVTGDDYKITIVFSQGADKPRGFTKRDLSPWLYEQRTLSAEELADDIFDFVLVEPHGPPNGVPDPDGVYWWPERG